MKKYNLLLIQPKLGDESAVTVQYTYDFEMFPPYSLLRIASLTPKNYKILIYDEQVDRIIPMFKPDLVGICIHSFLTKRAVSIAKFFKNKKIKVVAGGNHASIFPDYFLKYVDAVVIGDAELVWSDLLKDFEKNKLKKIYKSNILPDIRRLPPVDWKLIKNKRYLIKTVVQTTRGCVKDCEFCALKSLNKNIVRKREIGEVIEEIKEGIKINGGLFKKIVFFVDSDIYADPKYSIRLFKELKPLNIRWFAQSSINIGENKKIIKLAKDSGCRGLYIGFESINPSSLKYSTFKRNYIKNYPSWIKNIKEQGIFIIGSFVLGFDNDTYESTVSTYNFAKLNKIDAAEFEVLRAFPGTKIYNRINKNKIAEDFEVLPKNMSLIKLKYLINKFYSDFYSFKNIIKRILISLIKLRFKSTLLVVFYNLNKRKQILSRINISRKILTQMSN